MIVMKFGGTSVKNAEAIRNVINIAKNRNTKSVVVVSAFATVTNSLVKIIDSLKNDVNFALEEINKLQILHQNVANDLDISSEVNEFISLEFERFKMLATAINIIGEVSNKSKDLILSYGERLSSKIISIYAKNSGLNSKYVNSSEIIITDDSFTEAEVDFEATETVIKFKVLPIFNDFDVLICGGFIAGTIDGIITTLGRGGSDYSAGIIAAALEAELLDIYTDVDGILTTDPNLIKNAKLIKKLSYIEASELAYFGAKVLHPKTIFPAVKKNIEVRVLNSFNPHCDGTRIIGIKTNQNALKAIAFRKGITVINITSNRMLGAYGFLSKVFEVFKKHETSVDLVSTSEVSVSLTIDNKFNADKIIQELSEFSSIEFFDNKAIISVIGEGIRNTSGISARFFGILKDINIYMVSMGASEINLSIVVDEDNLKNAVVLLHDEFFSNELDSSIFEEIKR